MNDKLKQLALEIGGSHYPEVSKQYMEITVRLVIDQITQGLAPDRANALKQAYLGKFDLQ